MKQSQLFTKTRKEAPKDEVAKNAQLLIRAGYIHKDMAGVYSFLPLGLRVLNKVVQVIRSEMNAVGGVEVHLASLQDPSIWKKTDRWDDEKVDVWFKSALKNGSEVGFALTHEDPLTALMKNHVHSYRDLPRMVYQFQTKFRNETRAKSGIMRAREFVMKDLYTFARTQEEHDGLYERMKQAYVNVFTKLGIGNRTYVTFASGGIFSEFSHEFQTVTDAGEDIIYVDEAKKIAVNKEVYRDDVLADLGLNKADLVEKKAVEVGNIFSLGTRFSNALELSFIGEDGKKHQVIMGSYGIGPGRVMGTIVETLSDEKGIVWPAAIAPFQVHIVEVGSESGAAKAAAEKLYTDLTNAGIEVLYDDRDARAGEKFADSDLMGIPWRVVVSEKNIDKIATEGFEVVDRHTGKTSFAPVDGIIACVKTGGTTDNA